MCRPSQTPPLAVSDHVAVAPKAPRFLSKSATRMVVFQGRREPPTYATLPGALSAVPDYSQAQQVFFPPDAAKPVPLAVVSLDRK